MLLHLGETLDVKQFFKNPSSAIQLHLADHLKFTPTSWHVSWDEREDFAPEITAESESRRGTQTYKTKIAAEKVQLNNKSTNNTRLFFHVLSSLTRPFGGENTSRKRRRQHSFDCCNCGAFVTINIRRDAAEDTNTYSKTDPVVSSSTQSWRLTGYRHLVGSDFKTPACLSFHTLFLGCGLRNGNLGYVTSR